MKPVPLLLFWSVMACCLPLSGTETLTVLTYNIHHGEGLDGRVDLDRIVSVIKNVNADVVCLQEVDRNLSRTDRQDFPALLAEKLDMQVFFEPNYKFDDGAYGNATLTRFPVSAHRNRALPNPVNAEPRGCLTVTITWQGMTVNVLNTHLGLNGQERLAQAEAIIAALGDTPVILAGDMNENLTAPAMQRFTRVLRDTFEKRKDTPSGTIPPDAPRRRIDYILVHREFETVDSEIIQNDITRVASDHLPYRVVLHKPATAE